MTLFSRHLAVIMLLAAMLIALLNSVAHSIEIVMLEEACACHILQNDCHHGSSHNQEDKMPCDSNGDCCDHEECSHDAAEPPSMRAISAGAALLKQFYPYSNQIPPGVYLDIFVPPES